jgi:hypothetical protein
VHCRLAEYLPIKIISPILDPSAATPEPKSPGEAMADPRFYDGQLRNRKEADRRALFSLWKIRSFVDILGPENASRMPNDPSERLLRNLRWLAKAVPLEEARVLLHDVLVRKKPDAVLAAKDFQSQVGASVLGQEQLKVKLC